MVKSNTSDRKPFTPHKDRGIGVRDRAIASLGYASYTQYLSSVHWLTIRESVLDQYPDCRCCGRRADVVHHDRYDYLTMSGRSTKFLVSLCHECHEEVEFLPDGTKADTRTARKRLHDLAARLGSSYSSVSPPPIPFPLPAQVLTRQERRSRKSKIRQARQEYDACLAVGRKPSRAVLQVFRDFGMKPPRPRSTRKQPMPEFQKQERAAAQARRLKRMQPPPGPITYDEMHSFNLWLEGRGEAPAGLRRVQPPEPVPDHTQYRPVVIVPPEPVDKSFGPRKLRSTHPDGNYKTRKAAQRKAYMARRRQDPDWIPEEEFRQRQVELQKWEDLPEPVVSVPHTPSARLLRFRERTQGRTGSPVVVDIF